MARRANRHTGRLAVLWGLFFLICFSLGYPTLNCYDPRIAGNTDSVQYYKLVTGSPQDAAGHWRYRVLVPYLAKPFYWLAKGRVGTWDPVFFGLLVVNASFCATSALLLVVLGHRMFSDYAVALLGALLYLLNFAVINGQLAGLVDSCEGCLMLAVTWAMFSGRWLLLPILGVLGALAKETFVPLSSVFAIVWWLTTTRHGVFRPRRVVWVVTMGITGLVTVIILQSVVSGYMIWPWDVVLAEKSHVDLLSGFLGCIFSHGFWFVFMWLLPLGIWRCLGYLPRTWVFSSIVTMLWALILGAWHGAGGNVARALFNTAGPVLSLSTAMLIASAKSDCQRIGEPLFRTYGGSLDKARREPCGQDGK